MTELALVEYRGLLSFTKENPLSGDRAEGEVSKSRSGEIGSSGLVRSGGYVQEEFLPDLQGDKAIKVYKEMRDNDPIAGALIFAITNLMRQIKWSVKPGSDDQAGLDAAQFLEECMNDMNNTWADVISEICSMFAFGWALLEPVYKKRNGYQPDDGELPTSKYEDGRIGWKKMPLRAQETKVRWEFDDKSGGLAAMIQSTTKGEVPIPITSALLFRTQTYKNNPEGRSIFRNAYRPWYFKKRMEEIEGIGVERDLAGLPIMYVPVELFAEDATDEEKNALAEYKRIVQNVRRDKQEGMVLPSIYDEDTGNQLLKLELLSASGSRSFDTAAIITRYSQNMTMTVLADWLMLGHEGVGSFALSSNKSNLFGVALGAWKDMICAVFNNFAVPRLFRMNGFPVSNLPQIVAEDIEAPDLAVISVFLGALQAAGAPPFPNRDLLKRLYQMAGFPEPTDDQMQAMEDTAALMAEQETKGTTPEEDAEIDEMVGA